MVDFVSFLLDFFLFKVLIPGMIMESQYKLVTTMSFIKRKKNQGHPGIWRKL